MQKVLIREYGDWIPVFCLPGIFGISKATVYRSLKACGIKTRSLYGIITVVMCRDLYRFYKTKWFNRYVKSLRVSKLADYKVERSDYVLAYAELSSKNFHKIFHPPDKLIQKGLLEVNLEQLTDLVDSGLVPTIQVDNVIYCLPWWFQYVDNKR